MTRTLTKTQQPSGIHITLNVPDFENKKQLFADPFAERTQRGRDSGDMTMAGKRGNCGSHKWKTDSQCGETGDNFFCQYNVQSYQIRSIVFPDVV